MRRVSMVTRDELVAATALRYRGSSRSERGRILDEFAATTGYHRKHVMRLLRAGGREPSAQSRRGRRRYDDWARAALTVLWEASDRICGKRLKALMPILVAAMERHGYLQLEAEVRCALLGMSAATIDRVFTGHPAGGEGSTSAPEFCLGRAFVGACRSGRSATGTTPRPGLARRTSSCTADR